MIYEQGVIFGFSVITTITGKSTGEVEKTNETDNNYVSFTLCCCYYY